MPEPAVHLLRLVYFMAPAYVANMAPPFVRFWKGWNRPIHETLLGSHKTVVGFLAGVLAALGVVAVQMKLEARALEVIDYDHWIALGLAFGIGAMGGDCVKSYFKRRRGLAPGSRWLPFDQIDFALGTLLIVGPFSTLTWREGAVILIVTFIGDVLVNRLGFVLGIRTSAW